MLETPFGEINIIVDGVVADFEAEPFDYIKPPVKLNRLQGVIEYIYWSNHACYWH